jgi:GH15 family glucan-1,4-alpha-glucosidase
MAGDPLTMAGRIEDYAMIGDLRTAALVCKTGSIDWFCVPRFDSAACFAGLLGTDENGCWSIAPKDEAKIRRRYFDGSLILETTFTTKTGRATLIDFMPVGTENSSIIRLVRGDKGVVKFLTDLIIRFDYGLSVPWVARTDEATLTAIAGPNMLSLRTPARLTGKDMHTKGTFTVSQGEFMPFVLTHSPSNEPPPLPLSVETAFENTKTFWREWSGRYQQKGKWAEIVRRSLITLKGLTFRETGGMVAAITTSLPEQIGGPRNWDYRYCWLRDATFTLLAFLNAGYTEEALRWQGWLMRTIAGSPDQFQTMYGVAGERRLDEYVLDWLPGYENSKPVRIGNAAARQLQIDIYGELADVMAQARAGGLPPDPRRREIFAVFLTHLEKVWREPDEGIWEIRGDPQHFVHSKAMAWVAFDRAARSPAAIPARTRKHWKKIADEIHADICKNGVDNKRKCFVQTYGSTHMDASLLMLAIVGFLPPSDPRIRNTVREIVKRLKRDGVILRYETASGVDGLPPGEGAFLACSFWLVDNYLLLGRKKAASQLFGKLVKLRNDVGLLAEEYDPVNKRMLGNFPQAFSHVALVNSALNLMHASQPRKPGKTHVSRRSVRDRK